MLDQVSLIKRAPVEAKQEQNNLCTRFRGPHKIRQCVRVFVVCVLHFFSGFPDSVCALQFSHYTEFLKPPAVTVLMSIVPHPSHPCHILKTTPARTRVRINKTAYTFVDIILLNIVILCIMHNGRHQSTDPSLKFIRRADRIDWAPTVLVISAINSRRWSLWFSRKFNTFDDDFLLLQHPQ